MISEFGEATPTLITSVQDAYAAQAIWAWVKPRLIAHGYLDAYPAPKAVRLTTLGLQAKLWGTSSFDSSACPHGPVDRFYSRGSCPPTARDLTAHRLFRASIVFRARAEDETHPIVIACNLTPVPRHNYRVGVSFPGLYREIVNTDAKEFGGSGQGNMGAVEATPVPHHGRAYSLNVTLPPSAAVFLKRER